MKWEKITRFGKIIGAEVEIDCFKLSVHHYRGCENTNIWFASCYGGFDRMKLGEMSLNDAQIMAVAKLQLKLESALRVITKDPIKKTLKETIQCRDSTIVNLGK